MSRARRRGAEAGQATIEHAAIVLLVAVLLGAAVLAGARASAHYRIAESVKRQMARALCLVDGDSPACTADRTACLVSERTAGLRISTDFVVVHRGQDWILVKERMSDGSVAMTIADKDTLGLAGSVGAGGKVKVHGKDLEAGASADAQVLGRAGVGTTWIFDDEGSADRWANDWRTWVARVAGHGSSIALAKGDPDSIALEGSFDVTLGAQAGVEGLVDGSLKIGAEDTYGIRLHRDGTRDVYLRRENSFTGSLSALEGAVDVNGDITDPTHEEYALNLGPDGRPRELIVTTSGRFRGSRDLPAAVRGAEGYVGGGGEHRRYVLERHLSLASAHNRQLAASYIDRVIHPTPKFGRIVDVSAELRAVLDAEATAQIRAYDDDDRSWGGGAKAALGIKVGASFERVDERSSLVGAAARGPDGEWYRRDDCLAAA